MLEQHLDATGLSIAVKLRHITDPHFWDDFDTEGKSESDLKTAAIRKTTELRKVATERIGQNQHQYAKFSERLRELLEKLDNAQLSWADKLKLAEDLAHDLEAEAKAHEGTGLSAGAYGLLQVLRSFDAGDGAAEVATRIRSIPSIRYGSCPRHADRVGPAAVALQATAGGRSGLPASARCSERPQAQGGSDQGAEARVGIVRDRPDDQPELAPDLRTKDGVGVCGGP